MTTLVLAERPFRDLRSRAILGDLVTRLGGDAPPFVATNAPRCPPGFRAVPQDGDPGALGIRRAVLAGLFNERAELEAMLGLAGRALAAGATFEARGLSVERAAAKRDAPAGIAALDAARLIEVRDHQSLNTLLVWRVAAPIRIEPYPERHLRPDPALAEGLQDGPLLGLSVLGGAEVGRAVEERGASLAALLAPMRGWPVLPLPAEAPGSRLDDLEGSRAFAARFLPDSPWLLPGFDDPVWRRRQLSPARLAGLVARCARVVTNQDLPALYAIANGVPVLGLALGWDRRAVSCFSSLANELPPGSDMIYPAPDRAISSARA